MSLASRWAMLAAASTSFAWAAPASADLVLSELIVELQPGKQVRDDVEVWNNSPDRSYVSIEPREIINPSLSSQGERKDPDPQKLGLLVSPSRMILEPGQRKLVRIAALVPDPAHEHVFRVTVKPVVGSIKSEDTGLKVVIGYDVLVLVRPLLASAHVTATRKGRALTFSNSGNVSVEIIDGKQCASPHSQCTDLPGKRLYPGASWTVELPTDLPADYVLKSPGHSDRATY